LDIAGGLDHSLALRADGTVVAWGNNTYGQTDVPASASNIVSVAAGFYHSLALRSDGTIIAWGNGFSGSTNVPTALRNVASIAAREMYNLAVVETGPPRFVRQPTDLTVHAGSQAILSLRLAGTHPLAGQWLHDDSPVADATSCFLLLTNVQSGDGGQYVFTATNSLGRTNSQPAHVTVLNSPFVATPPSRKSVPPGQTLCLQVNPFGVPSFNYRWQLNGVDLQDDGRISGTTSSNLCVDALTYGDIGSYSVVVGNAFGFVTNLMAQVTVSPIIAWGDNSAGQTDVPATATNAVAIAAGGDGGLCLRADGSLVAWGNNANGQNEIPLSVTNVISIAKGESHAVALCADGSVIAWGDNFYGQTNVSPAARNVIAVAAGYSHSLALRADGAGISWGSSASVSSFRYLVAIAAGNYFSLGLRDDGTVVGAGISVPPEATNVTAIAAGDSHCLALDGLGKVIAWGNNYFGQTNVPSAATNIVAIAASGDRSLALRADGVVFAWGEDYSGENVVPPYATNIVSIAAGSGHNLAMRRESDSSVMGQPSEREVTLGSPTLLTAPTSGGSPASYQWQFNGRNILDATNAGFALGYVHWTNTGTYRYVVSNVFGAVTGPPMILTAVREPLRFDPASVNLGTNSNSFQAQLLGASGVGPVIFYASTNLQVWEPVFTNPPVIGPIDFSNLLATDRPVTVYRAAEGTILSPLVLGILPSGQQENSAGLPLRVSGLSASGSVIIYASSNLVDWEGVFTNPPTIGPVDFWDSPSPSQSRRFYRAGETRP
jgi:alpha-tubulin suppressor-like RCC1 family protein